MPSCSPARAAREVYERDILRLGTACTSRSTSVVFPVPEAADTMNSRPRRGAAWPAASLDILHLLAHLLELRLGRDDQFGDIHAVGLRADRIDLAVHLL